MPLEHNILKLAEQLGIPSCGIDYITRVITSPPSRRVGHSRHPNVATRFASSKMGMVIQAESRTCEYPFLLRNELDPDTIAFYCQPEKLQVRRKLPNGKSHVSKHTYDYLLIRRDNIQLIECRDRATLEALVANKPLHWVCEQGLFRCLPYQDAARSIGLGHRIFCADEVGAIESANLSILIDALRNVPGGLDERVLERALRKLECGSSTLDSLRSSLRLESPAVLLRLIATHRLHACLDVQYLANIYTARVYATESEAREFAEAFETASSIERILLNGSVPTSSVTSEARANIRTLSVDALSMVELEESLRRLRQIEPVLKHERAANRTERRWLKRMREGIAIGRSPTEAIASRAADRGNDEVRLDEDQLVCAENAIRKFWLTHIQPSMRATWLAIEWPKDANGQEKPISYARFCELCDAVEEAERERARGGHRAAQSVLPASHPAARVESKASSRIVQFHR